MYSREKLTIKGRASRRVFPSKNALQTKRPVFYSPGAFTGEEVAEHLNYLMHKHEAPLFLKRDNGSNFEFRRSTFDFANVCSDSL